MDREQRRVASLNRTTSANPETRLQRQQTITQMNPFLALFHPDLAEQDLETAVPDLSYTNPKKRKFSVKVEGPPVLRAIPVTPKKVYKKEIPSSQSPCDSPEPLDQIALSPLHKKARQLKTVIADSMGSDDCSQQALTMGRLSRQISPDLTKGSPSSNGVSSSQFAPDPGTPDPMPDVSNSLPTPPTTTPIEAAWADESSLVPSSQPLLDRQQSPSLPSYDMPPLHSSQATTVGPILEDDAERARSSSAYAWDPSRRLTKSQLLPRELLDVS